MLLQGLQHHSIRLFALGNNVPKVITTCRFIHFAPRERCMPFRASFTKDFYKRTNLLAAISVRHNSTTPQTETLSNSTSIPIDAFPSIPDTPEPVVELAQAAIQFHANGDPTFSSIGLGGYGPIGLLQYFIEFLHVHADLSWSASIITATLVLKLLILPANVKVHKAQIIGHNHSPEMKAFQQRIMQEESSGNMLEASMIMQEQKRYIERHQLNPMKTLLYSTTLAAGNFLQFFAVRGIVMSDLESLRFGGYWWFSDLTAPDPQYFLPIAAAASIALLTEGMLRTTQMDQKILKIILRCTPLLTFPVMINFSSGVQLFWLISTLFGIAQAIFLRVSPVKRWLQIPERRKLQPGETSVVANLTEMRLQSQMKKNKKTLKYQDHLLMAARQPYVKTFKYNPKAQLPSTDNQKLKMK